LVAKFVVLMSGMNVPALEPEHPFVVLGAAIWPAADEARVTAELVVLNVVIAVVSVLTRVTVLLLPCWTALTSGSLPEQVL
jgi:hypothetical protein